MTACGLILENGTRVELRPLEREDGDRFRALFARLSPESRLKRFLSLKPELTRRELAYLTDIDHLQYEAIAAIDHSDQSIVGVARYVAERGNAAAAELAVEVADEFQALGIGTALARRIIQRARANGLALVTATTWRDNQPARALLRRYGFRTPRSNGRAIEYELRLT
jgi:RimJ/RimL family protein N-acetyltransferase